LGFSFLKGRGVLAVLGTGELAKRVEEREMSASTKAVEFVPAK
jgi:hypothetical protein